MTAELALRYFFAVLATVVSIPAVTALIRASMFFGELGQTVKVLQRSSEDQARSMKEFTVRVDESFRLHGERLTQLETTVENWDGVERRHAERRKGD